MSDMIAVARWQMESVRRETKTELREWNFSPIIGKGSKIAGWFLMHYQLSVPCSLGFWHAKKIWFGHDKSTTPDIPKDVWNELFKKTKRLKLKPWPGRD